MTIPVHIRWMIRRDMTEVLDIENRSFDFPWLKSDFVGVLSQKNAIGMVADHGDKVVAFMLYELHKRKLHLLNFAVDYDFRRAKVGTQMIRKLYGKLGFQRRTHITLEVRETNVEAQCFFKSMGFKAVQVLVDYYDDTPEDAYVMRGDYRPELTMQALNQMYDTKGGA